MSLPSPSECGNNPGLGSCVNTMLLNQLDGFNPNARITVCFSAPIDTNTVAGSISISPVNGGGSTPINQVILDPSSNCVYAKPDVVLNQGTQYLLTVTNGLKDINGKAVTAAPAYQSCNTAYCQSLKAAVGKKAKNVVGASLFTTMSVSDWLEKARAKVNSFSTPELVLPAALPYVFPLANVSKMSWNIDSGAGLLAPQDLLPAPLDGVESIAFGLFLSPNYLATSGAAAGSIVNTATNLPIANPTAMVPVSFHVFLPPASKAPDGGYPVVIYNHGLGDSQFGAPTYMASTLAKAGFATVAIEVVGHGFGPLSTVQITTNQNQTTTVKTPGRGIVLPGNTIINATDGCILPGPLAIRDCVRQTVVDLMQFTRTLNDFQGFGLPLNPNRVYLVGQSLGSISGSILQALEPRIRASVINGGGGTQADVARLSITGRMLGDGYLMYANPALFNVAPSPLGAPPQAYFYDAFNDNYPYRGTPITNNVPGAIAIQAAFEQAEWLVMSGDALAYGPLLQNKKTAFQFGIGDLEVPNPTESALVRAAQGQSSTWILNMGAAAGIDPTLPMVTMSGSPLPILPHRILSNPTLADPLKANELSIALAEQQQAAQFFSSDGNKLVNPNGLLQGIFAGKNLFMQPGSLPDTLNYPPFLLH